MPPQANFDKLNPHISLAGTRISVPTVLTPWVSGSLPRVAAVSAFGIGGTNANVILEEAPKVGAVATDDRANTAHVLTLSAHNPAALQALTQSWAQFLTETPASVTDLCYTASVRRTPYDHRVAVVGRSKEDLSARLQDYLDLDQTIVPDVRPIGVRIQRCLVSALCSAGKGRSGMQWAESCSQERRFSVRLSTRAIRCYVPCQAGLYWMNSVSLKEIPVSTRLRSPSRHCSLFKSPWPRFGNRGESRRCGYWP